MLNNVTENDNIFTYTCNTYLHSSFIGKPRVTIAAAVIYNELASFDIDTALNISGSIVMLLIFF